MVIKRNITHLEALLNLTFPTEGGAQILEGGKVKTVGDKTVHAQWKVKILKLADVVSIGDYVNYPVEYTNIGGDEYSSVALLTGWRVLDVSGDEVKLVSAGLPLGYFHGTDSDDITASSENSVSALTTNFLEANLYGNILSDNKTLTEIFTNEYTSSVRAMTKADLDKVYDPTGVNKTQINTSVSDDKYNNLLSIPGESMSVNYWLATAYDKEKLWFVMGGMLSADCGFPGDSYGHFGIRPVVILNTGVSTIGKDSNDVWQLCMPTSE